MSKGQDRDLNTQMEVVVIWSLTLIWARTFLMSKENANELWLYLLEFRRFSLQHSAGKVSFQKIPKLLVRELFFIQKAWAIVQSLNHGRCDRGTHINTPIVWKHNSLTWLWLRRDSLLASKKKRSVTYVGCRVTQGAQWLPVLNSPDNAGS